MGEAGQYLLCFLFWKVACMSAAKPQSPSAFDLDVEGEAEALTLTGTVLGCSFLFFLMHWFLWSIIYQGQ
jgi:hypothetical protein